MKHFLVLLAAAVLGIAAFSLPKTTTALTGNITDGTGAALSKADIKAMKNTELVGKTNTDARGNFRLELAAGTYDVEISATGHETRRILGVQVHAGKPNVLNLDLNTSATDEVVVSDFNPVMMQRSKSTEGEEMGGEDTGRLAYSTESRPYREERAPSSPAMSKAKPMMDAKREAGRRADKADYAKDAAPAYSAPAALETKPAMLISETYNATLAVDDRPTEPPVSPGGAAQPSPRAGLLTAGEWNDLHNWNTHWADLLKDGELDQYQKMYKFFPKNRYSVLLQTEEGLPISDAVVQLHDKSGVLVWESRTSNTGLAELWSGFFGEKTTESALTLTAELDGKRHALGTAKAFSEGINQYKIKRECRHSKTVDIVWTVDATGSMGDELEYLKTELLDVIGRVQTANPDLDVRMGSVFYRDQDDDYIVKSSALNRDIAKTVDYIRKQSAGGGGDYPEAVHSALEETLRQPWSREAVARICFLVLDASPHQRPEVLESLQKSIREAAKRGIRIVPISGSGIQKDTEFLMKFFGLATNGSYVFLTDHSGIGGKHIEPTTDEYKVEQLNDLLVRLITEYATVPSCEGKSSILFADRHNDPQQSNPASKPVLYYPNPAVSRFNLELPFEAEKVTLYDPAGKAVHSLAQVQAGLHSIPVHDLPPGFYTLRIWKDGQVQSGKVMVVRA